MTMEQVGDTGYAGAYAPQIVNSATLADLRNNAGPPAFPGKKWYMVNLDTGECKWYQATRRRYNRRSRYRN